MIAECAADLLSLIKTIPALTDSTSLSIGGRSADPGLVKVPLPAAWLTFGRESSDERDYQRGPPSGEISDCPLMLAEFRLTVFIPYATDDDLLTVQFPLLESIPKYVHGKVSPSGMKWRYLSQVIALVYPDRLAYEQRYTLDWALQQIEP